MKLGLYGGSFDPVHRGHIDPIVEACRRLRLDRVIYLPTANPPHKPDRLMAPAHRRFTMVELAALEHPELMVSAHELTPGVRAFSIDSVEHFAREYPQAHLHLVVGADSYRHLDTWHRWRELVALCDPVVLVRPGWDFDQVLDRLHPELKELVEAGRATVLENPPVDVSSTRLREMLSAGEDVPEEMMPPLVVEYVRKYNLYS